MTGFGWFSSNCASVRPYALESSHAMVKKPHFLLCCRHPALKFQREHILCKACTILPTFDILKDADKLVFILSNCEIIFLVQKTYSKMLNIRTDYQEQILCDINTFLAIYILYSLSV